MNRIEGHRNAATIRRMDVSPVASIAIRIHTDVVTAANLWLTSLVDMTSWAGVPSAGRAATTTRKLMSDLLECRKMLDDAKRQHIKRDGEPAGHYWDGQAQGIARVIAVIADTTSEYEINESLRRVGYH